jgi:uncharacterized membrane protein
MKEKILYSWKAEEFDSHEKTLSWYIGTTTVFLGVIVLFVLFFHQYLAGLVVLLGLIALYAHANHQPNKINCQITNRRIKVGSRHYPFQKLKSFWLVNRKKNSKLYLHTTALLFSIISIPLGEGKSKKIKEGLKNLLPESGQGESINDLMTRWLKF